MNEEDGTRSGEGRDQKKARRAAPPPRKGVYDEADDAELWATFERVRRNRAACLPFLVSLTQSIERMWAMHDDGHHHDGDGEAAHGDEHQPSTGAPGADGGVSARVVARLLLLRRCLEDLREHRDADLRELSRLADKIKPDNIPRLSLKHFLGLFLPIERQYTRGLADHEFLIQRVDEERQPPASRKIPLILVLDNLRSAFNVGAIFRTAECFGVQKIYLCGYTATPDEEKTLRTTMNAHNYLAWEWHQRTSDVLDMIASGRYTLGTDASASPSPVVNRPLPIVALETVEGQRDIYSYKFPSKAEGGLALVLGNERHGVEADLLKKCTAIVSIPCVGVKNSLNVGVAFGICVYEISRQWHHEVLESQPQ